MLRLDRDTARRLAVSASLLDGRPPEAIRGPDGIAPDGIAPDGIAPDGIAPDGIAPDGIAPHGILGLVRHFGSLRIEQTDVVAPAADHVAWSRLGPSYRPATLVRAVADGELFERAWLLRPMADLPLFLAGMRSWADRSGARAWLEANEPFARGVLDRVADLGALSTREIPDEAIAPWPSSGWNDNRNVAMMLECLHMTGRLAVIGHDGRYRLFDLAERVYPSGVAELPEADARRRRGERYLASMGVLRHGRMDRAGEHLDSRELGEEATIDGVGGRWRVDPDVLARADATPAGRTAILSPFDRLMADRRRVAEVFGFEYALEMYRPRASRRWGYFALPVLVGDRLVGKVDAAVDRGAGELVVNAVHEDAPLSPDARDGIRAELDALADWLGVRLRMR